MSPPSTLFLKPGLSGPVGNLRSASTANPGHHSSRASSRSFRNRLICASPLPLAAPSPRMARCQVLFPGYPRRGGCAAEILGYGFPFVAWCAKTSARAKTHSTTTTLRRYPPSATRIRSGRKPAIVRGLEYRNDGTMECWEYSTVAPMIPIFQSRCPFLLGALGGLAGELNGGTRRCPVQFCSWPPKPSRSMPLASERSTVLGSPAGRYPECDRRLPPSPTSRFWWPSVSTCSGVVISAA